MLCMLPWRPLSRHILPLTFVWANWILSDFVNYVATPTPMKMTYPPPLVIIKLSHFLASVAFFYWFVYSAKCPGNLGCLVDNLPILTLKSAVAPSLMCFSLLSWVVCVGYMGLDSHQRLMLSFVVYVLFFFLCIGSNLSVNPIFLPKIFGNQGKHPSEVGAQPFLDSWDHFCRDEALAYLWIWTLGGLLNGDLL